MISDNVTLIFSFAIILWILKYRETNLEIIFGSLIAEVPHAVIHGKRPQIKADCSKELERLLTE